MNKIAAQGNISGTIAIPSSKSQTIRALLIASAAEGVSRLHNPLDSQDTLSCFSFCKSIGAEIVKSDTYWDVTGISGTDKARELSLKYTKENPLVLDVGNSGTTLYLGAGFAASLGIPVILTGDEQIRSRPVENLLNSLRDLGAEVSFTIPESHLPPSAIKGAPGCPPVYIKGPLQGGSTSIDCPTSQYLSCLLLAAPAAMGQSTIEVTLLNEAPYAEMTMEWLDDQEIPYQHEGMSQFTFPGKSRYQSFEKLIPGDYSSASFFFCAAAVTGSTLTIDGLVENDSQGDKAVLGWLEQMGCTISWDGDAVTVSGSAPGKLKGIDIDLNAAPDALPILAVTGCFAGGTTRLLNVPQARIKETDRIEVMAKELTLLGADITELEDGLVIQGVGKLSGGVVEGHGDHRVIMSLAVAGLCTETPLTITGAEATSVTFPTFFSLLDKILQN
ncbi:MAG: 3-phosphoshikimate 1-carboxyvinyltransferase [Bacteroidetes bacterium]|nr:3-phosphoshikimate 1-carboxyvinyltransferase [Bacteroidota bacterium]